MHFAVLRSWWKSLRRSSRIDNEMGEELQFHIDAYAADLRKSGLSENDALAAARREFGSVALHKEDCRNSLGLRLADEIRSDIRYGLRMLLRDRVLTAVAVLSLALGIGVNIALFSFSKAVLFDSLPVSHPEQLRLLRWEVPGRNQPVGYLWGEGSVRPDGNFGSASFSYAVYQRLAQQAGIFSGLAAFNWVHKLSATFDGVAEMVSAQLVSGNFFDVVGVNAVLGRNLAPSDMRADAPPVAVVSYQFWTHRFGRSPAVLGQTIRVNTVSVTVVGVTPSTFGGPQKDVNPDLILPLSMQPRIDLAFDGNQLENTNSWWLQLLGRKLPAVSDAQVQAALGVVLDQAARDTLPRFKGGQSKPFQLQVAPGSRGNDHLRERFAHPTYLLWALAGLVLLLACSNVANLLLARASVRQSEMAVRLALGAGRARVARQMLVESSLLALLAVVGGLLVAFVAMRAIPAFLSGVPPVAFDGAAAVFAAVVAGAAALTFGFAPALQAARTRLETGDNMRSTADLSKISSRKALVVLQVALSAVLLIACGLFSRTLINLSTESLGIETDHLLLFDLTLPEKRYPPAIRIATQRKIMDRLEAIPGVRHASVARDALTTGDLSMSDFARKGQLPGSGARVRNNLVDVRFFQTAGIPILRGRSFNERDTESSQPVAIINSKLARALYPNQDPLGQVFNGDVTIIGIAGDTTSGSLRQGLVPLVYLPFTQLKFWGNMTFYVRTTHDPKTIMASIRKVVHALDRDLPLMNMRTQTEQTNASLSQERLFTVLTSSFALLSLLLGGIGVYGITQFNVVRRTNEIGIRMALGAPPRVVVASILREGFLLVFVGVVVGTLVALGLTRLIASYLYGVSDNDPLTFAMVAFVLGVTTVLAVWRPARRAARISPLEALRHQ